jgi:peptidoglycan/LPS O-acetylase OafA/YrhL
MAGESYALGRRPALDGLRGLAILLVLWGHSNGADPRGYGLVGVILFFTLSGFLITRLLCEEHSQTRNISLRGFWLRRARRLLPALALFLLAMAAAGTPPAHLAVAAFYLADIPFFTGGGMPGLGHMWSLALEEQFYLAWPPILMIALRRKPKWIAPMLGTAVAVVFAYRFHITPVPQFTAEGYVDALLLGCLLAVTINQLPRRFAPFAGLLGAPLLAAACWLPSLGADPLGLSLAAAAATLMVWGAAEATVAPRWLNPIRMLGRISYGVYLWHYPLAVALAPRLNPWATFAITAASSIAIAALSYRLLERPIMARGQRQRALAPDETVGGPPYGWMRRLTPPSVKQNAPGRRRAPTANPNLIGEDPVCGGAPRIPALFRRLDGA